MRSACHDQERAPYPRNWSSGSCVPPFLSVLFCVCVCVCMRICVCMCECAHVSAHVWVCTCEYGGQRTTLGSQFFLHRVLGWSLHHQTHVQELLSSERSLFLVSSIQGSRGSLASNSVFNWEWPWTADPSPISQCWCYRQALPCLAQK